MIFEGERIDYMQEMIMADNVEDRQKAKLQQGDFEGIFRAMKGIPRHHSAPGPTASWVFTHRYIESLAKKLGKNPADLELHVEAMSESNPMLGYRGCRLGISYPEITAMQSTAIFEAAAKVRGEKG